MKKEWYELFTRDSRCFFLGTQEVAAQRMLDSDFKCRRSPSVAGFVGNNEGLSWLLFGKGEIAIPIYTSLEKAAEEHPDVDIVINFRSFRSAFEDAKVALEIPSIRILVIIAEGIPERQMKILIRKAKNLGKVIIGPATVGGIAAGAFRIGNSGGTIKNIMESKLNRPGSVGYTGVSGGLFNEMSSTIAKVTDGVYESIPVGGDTYPGSTLLEHLLRYEANPNIKMLVMAGELGGRNEYDIVQALKDGRITKPLIAWVSGTCQEVLPPRTQFGHAGAKASEEAETAQAKNKALKEAGAIVPRDFDEFPIKIKETYLELVKKGIIKEVEEPEVPELPLDIEEALAKGVVRRHTPTKSTISDERGEVLRYAGYSVVDLIEKDKGIEDVMSLLWTKKLEKESGFDVQSGITHLDVQSGIIHKSRVFIKDNGDRATVAAARVGVDLVHSVSSGLSAINIPERIFRDPFSLSAASYLVGRTIDLIGHWLSVTNKKKGGAERLTKERLSKAKDISTLISLRWFKKEPKDYERELIKRIIMLLADNGPCVSGANITILDARAGIDLPQSVAAGISAIGPRFGGAITDASRSFKEGLEKGLSPREFVEWRKSIGKAIIPGIGHLVFNKDKPDSRFVCLRKYIKSLGVSTPCLDFALGVQEVTLEKRNNLILNIDGAIGVILTDLGYPEEALNAFFLLARTIGFTGHWLDQKRLKSPLYRTPYWLAGYLPEAKREVPTRKGD